MRYSTPEDFHQLSIGAVFTPLQWAGFAVRTFGLLDKWLKGASIFDPTMGEGNLLEAMIAEGVAAGYALQDLPIHLLYGVELNTAYYERFFVRMKEKYGIEMPRENFENADLFFLKQERTYDIILGNPPWQNFVDLPSIYKNPIKDFFYRYDLVSDARTLLLGGARIDIATLVIQKAIAMNLRPQGEAIFFMPLSLFLNDGANKSFRTYKIDYVKFAVTHIYDCNEVNVFEGIATRYGMVHFKRDTPQTFPIPYHVFENNQWIQKWARPIFHTTDALSVFSQAEATEMAAFEPIRLHKQSMPRQGVNSGGANFVFFFDKYAEVDEKTCLLSNDKQENVLLPKAFVHPMIASDNFRSNHETPQKWILLPCNAHGRPLPQTQLQAEPLLWEYLLKHKDTLSNRSGVLMQAAVKKGVWWTMLGVGPYNFYPYKIVWEAYGKKTFEPRIFEGKWQANQSLQAFIPLHSLSFAEQVLERLKDKRIESYLLSLKMEGTMNWAQPGKIKKFIQLEDDGAELF